MSSCGKRCAQLTNITSISSSPSAMITHQSLSSTPTPQTIPPEHPSFTCTKSINYHLLNWKRNKHFYLTLFLIIIPSVIFFSGVGNHYITELHLFYPLIIHIFLVLAVFLTLLKTHFSDPGIISRNIWPTNTTSMNYRGPNHKQHIFIGGQMVEIKWCNICHLFRPPRTSHCYICNNCVQRFDHHCPWIGNCIGIKNYLWFSIFINTLWVSCVWTLIFSVFLFQYTSKQVMDDGQTNGSWEVFVECLKREGIAFGISIYAFIILLFVTGLNSFHWFLICTAKTTNEQLRSLVPIGTRFSRSFIGNIVDMFCCTLPSISSRNADQEIIEEEDGKMNEKYSFYGREKVYLISNKQMVSDIRNYRNMQNVENLANIKNENISKIETNEPKIHSNIKSFLNFSKNKNGAIYNSLSKQIANDGLMIEITSDDYTQDEEKHVIDVYPAMEHLKVFSEEEKRNRQLLDLSKSAPRKDTAVDVSRNENLYGYEEDDDITFDTNMEHQLSVSHLVLDVSRNVSVEQSTDVDDGSVEVTGFLPLPMIEDGNVEVVEENVEEINCNSIPSLSKSMDYDSNS